MCYNSCMNDYCGNIEGQMSFSAPKPFALLGWPSEHPSDAEIFDSEGEARKFIETSAVHDPFVKFARLHKFSEG